MAQPPFIVIPYEPVSVTSTNQLASRPASHVAEFLYPGMIWQMGTGAIQARLVGDLGAVRPIDFAALLNVNRGGATPTATVYLGSTAGAEDIYNPSSTPVPDIAQSPAPAGDLYHWFHTLSERSARHVQWILLNASNFTGSAAFAIVGKRITFGRYAEHDWEIGVEDSSQISFTRSGVPDIAEGVIQRVMSFTMKWVSEAEYHERIAPLDALVGRQKPVLICFDPDAGSRRQALTFFGLLTENGRSRRINARAFERRFEIRSFI